MFNFYNWRFNPFTEIFNPVVLIAEQHTIGYDTEANAYGIRLHEEIELIGSLPFNTHVNYSITENTTGGAQFIEVPRTTPPSAGEFRVDYSANTYYATSFIQFNAADNGIQVLVNYRGKGTIVKTRYQLESDVIFPLNVGIQANLDVTDNVTIGIDLDVGANVTIGGNTGILGNTTIGGNTNIHGNLTLGDNTGDGIINGHPTLGADINADDLYTVKNLRAPVNLGDAVSLPFNGFSNLVSFTTPGAASWTPPDGVFKVFYEMGGGGGGGNSATDGGAPGGGAEIRIGYASVTPGNSESLTIGSGGGTGSNSSGGSGGSTTGFGTTSVGGSGAGITTNPFSGNLIGLPGTGGTGGTGGVLVEGEHGSSDKGGGRFGGRQGSAIASPDVGGLASGGGGNAAAGGGGFVRIHY